ncbi:hypothetical protein KAFR_0H02680 [Kazachstania africana CBS 2517]|uniref:Uncharacterized protein n=1 Tax=Kazachstania africana (strain ATCC 22294 / BCRC 22015 / CBS 2517 / CECT 1963 / NBRC 1671 / NRRL Y-8276) TaxID=1071382 RepID=H2AZC1_KAZAF|nr:hypothetical protein KAFR_0H02680 [Kazachstania africana CBS 2517]CCF59677.1 hypothetical protein KAFR_0H02680 [Kazachstania africana CBS 2517]
MTHSSVSQKYNLAVVSGGKPMLPRAHRDSTSCNKNISILTDDRKYFIVPFNNQIKIYSVETRQCTKTLKFSNNPLLARVFQDNKDVFVVNILLGDITATSHEEDRLITLVTNAGHIIVLNYKGKMVENPKVLQLNHSDVSKIFFDNDIKFLTTKTTSNSLQYYTFHSLRFQEDDKVTTTEEKSFENVILSSWSSNNKFISILLKENNEKHVIVYSISEQTVRFQFPLATINTSASFSNFVTSMAIDNTCTQLALGFASGVVTVTNLIDMKPRLLKWHIDAVLSLNFNADGTYLLSGGWEKVLSFWQLSTNLQHFLPRLNGVIIDIQVLENFYSLSLQMMENDSNSDYQLVLLNSADLISNLSIVGPLPVFNSIIQITNSQPYSSINSTSSINTSFKKQKRKLMRLKKKDFTTCIEINPVTKQLYIPHGSNLQTFDFYKNESVNLQYLTNSINTFMGKVKSELNIKDPKILNLKLSKDGTSLITYEIEFAPADLLSSDDIIHLLKFWQFNSNSDQWELVTKVLNPHGQNVPITNMIVSKDGCLTADNNGGIKYWVYDVKESNWCLKKILINNFNHFTNSVSMASSKDGSLLFHGFDDKLQIIDFETFRKLENTNVDDNDDDFVNEFTFDSEIQTIKLIGETSLLVATKATLNVIDLLLGKIINSFDIYPYVNGIYKNGNLERLITCDETNGKIAIVINKQSKDKATSFKSHVLVFNSNLSKKLGSFTHDEYIAWIGWNYDTDFIFLDIESRLGVIGTTVTNEIMLDESNKEGILDGLTTENDHADKNSYLEELRKLSIRKTNIMKGLKNDNEDVEEILDGETIQNSIHTKINMNSFTNMFDNLQNIEMETLFDSVLKTLS